MTSKKQARAEKKAINQAYKKEAAIIRCPVKLANKRAEILDDVGPMVSFERDGHLSYCWLSVTSGRADWWCVQGVRWS